MLASSLFLKALGSSLSASPAWVSLIPGFPSVVSLDASLHGWSWDPGSHPCLARNAASDELPDPNVGWSLLSRTTGRKFALYLLCHQQETLRKEHFPLLWSFQFFSACYDIREPFPGVVFCFLTFSSIWDIDVAPRFLLSFTILISLFLSLSLSPHTPVPLILSGHREQG